MSRLFPTLELQEAFTTALTADVPAWETVASSYEPGPGGLRSFDARQGKSSDLDRDSAGVATFVVDVRDRELDPSNADSTHAPYVTPNRPIRLAVGYVAEVLRDNPRSYWRLNEYTPTSQIYRDEQRASVATGVNTPTPFVDGVLTGNHAVTFTAASSEYIDTGNLAMGGGDRTYEAWAKTVTGSGIQTIFHEHKIGGSPTLISLEINAGRAAWSVINDAAAADARVSAGTYSDGAFHHFVLTKAGAVFTVYVDGVVVVGPTTLFSSTFTFDGSRIGAGETGSYFNGTIDEVAVYTTALSAARVAAHHTAGRTGIGGYVHSGYVDAHNVSYRGPHDAIVTIPSTDRMKLLARAHLIVSSVENSAAQRVTDILATLGYYFRSLIYQGAAILQAVDGVEQNALDAINEAVDTENGRCYVEKDGTIVFLSRRAINENPQYTTSQATFSDSGAAGVIPYTDIVFENSDTLLRNSVEISHPELAAVTVSDATSIAAYGLLTYQRTVHDVASTAMNATAEAILARYKDPQTRILSVTVPTSRTTATYPNGMYGKVLSLELGYRVTVERTPPGGGDPISQECFILSQSHQCDASKQSWTSTFGFALADDVTAYGMWDSAQWDTDEWGY